MATWTYQDFDTVCYSIQHNIMQLIKCVVDLSSSGGNNSQLIGDLFDVTSDIVTALNDISTILSQMNGLLAIHEQRIYNLEQTVYGGSP